MAYEYQLTLTVKETNETVSLSGSFQENEWNLLSDFLEYADDLLSTRFVRSGMRASLNIKWSQEAGMVVSAQLPNWDDVIVFLHKLRPIVLQSERTNFYRICNLLAKRLAHPYFRSMLDEQRKMYGGQRMQSVIQVRINDVVLNSEEVLSYWLNAFEYHRDKDKKKFIESLHEMFPFDASKVLFLQLLADKTQAIHNIAIFVRVVLRKQRRLEGILRLPE